MEAKTGIMLPPAKELQEPIEAGGDKEGFSLKAFGEHMALLTP